MQFRVDAVNDLLKTFEVPVIFITVIRSGFSRGTAEPAFLIANRSSATVSAIASQALFFERNANAASGA